MTGPRGRSLQRRARILLFLASILGFLFGAPARAAPLFAPLGDLPDGAFSSTARAASIGGGVVVGQATSASGEEAFRWTSGGRMVGLGDLEGRAFVSRAESVSADGSVVVGWGDSASGAQAFRWTPAGGMVGLGDLPGGATYSEAHGVSADGLVIVGEAASARTGYEAFRWTAVGGMVGLGFLNDNTAYGRALATSADGSVVVGAGLSGLGVEAFRWTSATGTVGLGDLSGGPFHSEANDVSADGSVVVGFGYPVTSANSNEAFRWTSATGMVSIGAPGTSYTNALGVSADGSLVVGSGVSGPRSFAFIWDSTRGMRSVRDELVARGLDMTGWELFEAWDVSDDGLGNDNSVTIIGAGRNPSGWQEAWLAQIPEPSTGLLSGSALLGLLALRRRRKKRVSLGATALSRRGVSGDPGSKQLSP